MDHPVRQSGDDHINDVQYVSPLAQVKGMLKGERKYANVSMMREVLPLAVTAQQTEATA
jgi:hypothetical protein